MQTLGKAIVIVLIVCAAAPTLTLIVLDQYYYSKRPRQPQTEVGRVYVKRAKVQTVLQTSTSQKLRGGLSIMTYGS
jgi:hypothetical protein